MYKRRRLLKNNHAGISAFVMILFGLIVICYMFGFASMWNTYTQNAGVKGVETEEDAEGEVVASEMDTYYLTSPALLGVALLSSMLNSVHTALVGTASIIGLVALIVLFRDNSTIWQYIIPFALLIVLNIFIFPISALQGELKPVDDVFYYTTGFSFTLILFAFFNLFYILSVLEFVRGSGT